MEQQGDYSKLTDEERLALRSVIAAFKSYDAEYQERPEPAEKPAHMFTAFELQAIYPSEPNLDIYTATREDFLNAAPNSRRHLK